MSKRRRLILLTTITIVGGLYGFAVSSIPSSHDPAVIWIGNICSPWLVLSFLGGRVHRSWIWAALAGALADVACVVGFYADFLSLDPTRLGLPRSTPITTVAAESLLHWSSFVAPWVVFAIGAGALYGLFGYWRASRRALIAGVAIGLPFLAEPWLWRIYIGVYKGPLFIWIAEAVVGIGVLAWIFATWRNKATHVNAIT